MYKQIKLLRCYLGLLRLFQVIAYASSSLLGNVSKVGVRKVGIIKICNMSASLIKKFSENIWKKCLASLIIKEMQIRTLRSPLPIKIVKERT